jgi:cytochrome c551/c552
VRRRCSAARIVRIVRPGDPGASERGKALYSVNCQFCHSADTRGGDGGPSLLRLAAVLADQHGELVAPPIVSSGRPGDALYAFALY